MPEKNKAGKQVRVCVRGKRTNTRAAREGLIEEEIFE